MLGTLFIKPGRMILENSSIFLTNGAAIFSQCRWKGQIRVKCNSKFRFSTMEGNKISQKIGFIGGGNMATAIVEGIVSKGLVVYNQLYISAPSEGALAAWKQKQANAFIENGRIVEESDIIFLAVKPHILPIAITEAYKTLKNPAKASNKLFVSIVAGITVESLEQLLGEFEGSRVIRVMPNTPMMVGEGCTVYCPGKKSTSEDIKIVHTLLSSSGHCYMLPESMINAVGALCASGPAFIFIVIEAMSDAAVKMGIPREMSTKLAAQTVLGAAKMVLVTGKHPGVLKDEVCSPGGTTITGVHALEKGGLRASLIDAVEAATNKSFELGQKLVKK